MTARARAFPPGWLLPLAVLVALAGFLVARPARAEVSVRTGVSARKIEVGQSLQFQLTAMGDGQTMAQDPRLAAPPGFQVLGPSIGSQTHLNMNTGQRTVGISATWTLVPQRAGTFRIGPASVDTGGGKRVKSGVETIEVVPQGTLPQRRRRLDPFSFDPFSADPFGGMFPSNPFGPRDEPEEPPPVPEEYRVERAPDRDAFLRAVVTPKHPVVGEQVTLRIYAYGGNGAYMLSHEVEPSRADFLAYTSPDSGMGEQAVRVPIGDASFIAQKVREIALFPLHSGKLVIGPMSLTFMGRGYRSPLVRQSERIVLEVEEPPLQGRPPGYKVGDVGELELAARVDPMRVVAGEGVSVVAKLSGTGNIPTSLVVPQQNGVEWLEPSVVEDIDAKGATVKGFRVFTYVVKLAEPGRVNLGDITLPYFDPKRRSYSVARAALGTVVVDPNPAKKAAPGASAAPFAASGIAKLPTARHELAAYAPPASPFTEGLGFWALLLGMPLGVALMGSGIVLGRRTLERLRARRTDPDRLAADALREADAAAGAGKAVETAGAIERALFRAIEAGTGLKARALLKGELESALAGAGVAAGTVKSTLSLLDACEALRFTEGAGESSPKTLADQARTVANDLARKRRRPK